MDYCNADARGSDAKCQKLREVQILDTNCTTGTLERVAFCCGAHYDCLSCLSPLSGAISAYLYRPTIVSPWSRSSGFPLYRPQCAVSVKSSFITALLLLAGDVEHSPGLPRATAMPTTDQLMECVNIGVFNCCSPSTRPRCCTTRSSATSWTLCFSQRLGLPATCWLTAVTSDIMPPHYASCQHFLTTVLGLSHGGGLAVVFRQDLVVRRHQLSDSVSPHTFEAQLVCVGLPPSSHTVLRTYRPQWKSMVAKFVDELSDVIPLLNANSTDNLVVCGDVNFPGPTLSSVDDGLAEMLDSLGLMQRVGLPTRDNMAGRFKIYSQLVVSAIRIADINNLK